MVNVITLFIIMALLYSDEKSVIEREINVENVIELSQDDILKEFEVETCAQWITKNDYKRVCLQFPDHLLQYSVDVASLLEEKTFRQIYILGDTSYGSCCVDEVGSSHVNADCIIHFGHSCLSIINRLPVLYIFSKKNLNLEKLFTSLSTLNAQCQIVLLYDTTYVHHFRNYNSPLSSVIISQPNSNSSSSCGINCMKSDNGHQVKKFGRQYCISDNDKAVIYVYICDVTPCVNLDNFIKSMPESTFYRYDPVSANLSQETSRIVKRHLFLCEKVKDAQTIGILIATLVVNQYLDAVNHVKALCKKHKKKSYIISVGKPNVPKLANFPEIDLYVMINCPEMSLPDSKEFLQPVVSLMDIELALNPSREWQNKINLDFSELLSGGSDFIECPNLITPSTDMSLLSNNIRTNGIDDTQNDIEHCKTISVKSKNEVSVITGREGLTDRSWQGLEQDLGLTPVSVISKGRTGTPSSGYITTDSADLT